jgi:Flp pilus assembly protein TadD
MKLNPIMLALSLTLTALPSEAQTIELGSDASGYRRFLLYPHLQKGFEAMGQGNRNRALTEFEQARVIAPNNALVATYLAEAYRYFGERARAEALLREQMKRNPGNLRLGKALGDLHTKSESTLALALALVLAPKPTVNSNPTTTAIPALAQAKTPALDILTRNTIAPRATTRLVRPGKPKLVTMSPLAQPTNQAQAFDPGVTPGYYFADTAYKTSAIGDFTSALPAAREAVRLEPDNPTYGKLLVYVLAQSGSYEEAEVLANQLLKDAVSDSQELMLQRQTIRRRLAFEHFEAANKALRSSSNETAVRGIRT